MELKVLRKSGAGYYSEPFKKVTEIVFKSYTPYRYNVAKNISIITILR